MSYDARWMPIYQDKTARRRAARQRRAARKRVRKEEEERWLEDRYGDNGDVGDGWFVNGDDRFGRPRNMMVDDDAYISDYDEEADCRVERFLNRGVEISYGFSSADDEQYRGYSGDSADSADDEEHKRMDTLWNMETLMRESGIPIERDWDSEREDWDAQIQAERLGC